MSLKKIFSKMFHVAGSVETAPRKHLAVSSKGIDVQSLKPTKPMSEAEKIQRYRVGRFAEMTDTQAGL